MSTDTTLRAAIVGCGRIAGGYDQNSSPSEVRTHAKAYQLQPMTELVAVADLDARRAHAFSAKWNVPKHYTDFREMITKEDPDIVSVCTSEETHVTILETCLNYPGIRAVWCEKPLADNVDDATAIVKAYESKGVVLAVNYQRRWDVEMQRIKQSIRSGEFGTIQKVVVYYTKGICHNGSHAVDLILDWLGYPDSIQSLASHVDFLAEDPTVDAHLVFDDTHVYLLGLDEGQYSIFEIDVLGTLLRVKITKSGHATEWYTRQDDRRTSGHSRLYPLGVERPTELSQAMVRALAEIVDAMSNGKQIRSSGATATETLRLCHQLASGIVTSAPVGSAASSRILR